MSEDGCGQFIGPYPCCTVVTGDARELALVIPNESIDLVFTDPPWDDSALPLYDLVAKQATRILKVGSFVVAYTGNDWLPQIMECFEQAGLLWFRMLAGVQLNSDDRYFRKKLFVKWRPIVVYSKSDAVPLAWIPDAAYTIRDKSYHEWGQGLEPAIRYIDRMMPLDGRMVDFFVGGGTFLAVCKMLGRHYLGFEIDSDMAERARKRVEDTQPPLFIIRPEQEQF